jgi:hypothetical protein
MSSALNVLDAFAAVICYLNKTCALALARNCNFLSINLLRKISKETACVVDSRELKRLSVKVEFLARNNPK